MRRLITAALRRLITAALLGTALAAVILFVSLVVQNNDLLAIVQTLYRLTTGTELLAFVFVFLLVFGMVPTVLIGVVLRMFHRASPVLLVATPATLFLFTLTEIAREMDDATLVLQTLPAMAGGGLLMFWVLSRPAIEPVEKIFE